MAKSSGANTRSQKDKEMAARMKREGVARTTGRCAQCYAIISTEGPRSRYTHICRG